MTLPRDKGERPQGDGPRLGIPVALLALAIVFALVRIGVAGDGDGTARIDVAALLALAYLAFCIQAPVSWLLPAALSISVFVPSVVYSVIFGNNVGEFVAFYSPATVAILIWIFRSRSMREPDTRKLPGWTFLALYGGVSLMTLFVSQNRPRSLAFLMFYMILFVFATRRVLPQSERLNVTRAWLYLGLVTAAYAIVERAIEKNVLYGALYQKSVGSGQEVQHWAEYRAQASFGHPIFAGLFFAATASYAFLIWLTSRKSSPDFPPVRWSLLVAVVCATGVLATGSRGAIIALICGLTAGIVLGLSEVSLGRMLAIAVSGLFIGLVIVRTLGIGHSLISAFVDRFDSQEAGVSADGRISVWDLTMRLSEASGWVGTGVGTSRAEFRAAGAMIPVESSPLQILLSTGILGLFVISVAFVSIVWKLWQKKKAGEIGLVCALLIGMAGFDGFEDVPNCSIWLSIATVLAMSTINERVPYSYLRNSDRKVGVS